MTDQVNGDTKGVFEQMLQGNTNTNPDQGKNASQGSTNPSFAILDEIKNERGEPKYKTVEDALAALKASQEYIPTLEKENQELRSVASEAKTIEQLMAQINSTKNSTGDNHERFSPEDIKTLVSQTLQETESKKIAQQNQQAVVDKLVEVFGEKAEEQYINKAKDLGLTLQEFNQLASRSPKAVLNYFSDASKGTPAKTTNGTVNTESHTFYSAKKVAPQTVMFGASTHDMVNAWRNAAVTVN